MGENLLGITAVGDPLRSRKRVTTLARYYRTARAKKNSLRLDSDVNIERFLYFGPGWENRTTAVTINSSVLVGRCWAGRSVFICPVTCPVAYFFSSLACCFSFFFFFIVRSSPVAAYVRAADAVRGTNDRWLCTPFSAADTPGMMPSHGTTILKVNLVYICTIAKKKKLPV